MYKWLAALPLFCVCSVHAQTFNATPLNDLGTGLYLNQFEGGLYENGTNLVPGDHAADGDNFAAQVGTHGQFVFLSIGMSNALLEFRTFVSFVTQPPQVSKINDNIIVLDGAQGDYVACTWAFPYGTPKQNGCKNINPDVTTNPYDNVLNEILQPAGLSESQVEVIWLKDADLFPTVSLPSSKADAYAYEGYLGDIARAARVRYPNLKLIFLASRIYAGYATVQRNPEPYAYEYGFSTKWAIQAQIDQIRGHGINPTTGDLSYSVAPWLAWGPYLWADGTTPRSDGLIWCNGQAGSPCFGEVDFQSDGTHPNQQGEDKVSTLLWNFFSTSEFTTSWFLENKRGR
jgi:hypothetical protein